MSDRDFIIQEIRKLFKEQDQKLPAGSKRHESESSFAKEDLNTVMGLLLQTPEGVDWMNHSPMSNSMLRVSTETGDKNPSLKGTGLTMISLQSALDPESVLVHTFKVVDDDIMGTDNYQQVVKQQKVKFYKKFPSTYQKHLAVEKEKEKVFYRAYGHYVKAKREQEKQSAAVAAKVVQDAKNAKQQTQKQEPSKPVQNTPQVKQVQQKAAEAVKSGKADAVDATPKDIKAVKAPSKTTQPTSSTEKVMPAKDARSTKDMPFAEITVPKEYEERYKQIKAGMDMGETGDCSSINNAAVEILGSDPRAIYTALINSGVLAANYVPPSKPCDGLSKLITNFQYLATQGKLRYQKKIDASGELTKGLTYKPTVDTPDLQQQAVAAVSKQGGPTTKQQQRVAQKAKPGQQVVNRPTINEQMVTVDGKIGSRTAKLLKIYANKESFDKLKDEVLPKPKPKPEPKPEPKKRKTNCPINFKSLEELLNKTALAIMGVHVCSLDEKYNIAIGGRQFKALAGAILSGEGGSSPETYIRDAQELAKTVKKNLSNKQKGLASYAVEDSKDKNLRIYGGKNTDLAGVLNNSFSDKIFKFYTGTYSKQQILGFSLVKAKDWTKPIYFSYSGNKDSQYNDVAEYYRGLNYNKWMTVPPNKREAAFEVGASEKSTLSSVKSISKLHLGSLRLYSKALNGITDPMGQIENNSDTPEMLEDCKKMVNRYMQGLVQFIKDLQAFESSPSEESLSALIGSGGMVSIAQRYTVHGDVA